MTLSSDNPLRLWKNLLEMSISEKIKTINNKIEQKKAQCNLDTQAAFLLYHQERIANMNFWLAKIFYPKDLLEKAAALKRFEYSPLGRELKRQTSVPEKQYQKLDNTYKSDKITKKENYSKSNVIYDANHN